MIHRSLAVTLASLLLSWPAIYNGYPLLYPDSMSYLEDGWRVAHGLVFDSFPEYSGGRGLIYCLGILPFHWNVTPWPLVGLNALLTAWILWLVTRSIAPRATLSNYLCLIALLSLLTGLGWFVSFIMPDIFGPLLYLSIYLVTFEWDRLSTGERCIVAAVGWFAAVSHSTHLLLAIGVWLFVAALVALRGHPAREPMRAVARVGAILLLAAAGLIGVHWRLYGEPSLDGKRPPFLMARVIADGPGRWYLQERCSAQDLAICRHVDRLPDNVRDFLWAPNGIWRSAAGPEQERLRKEEMAVVLGTLRAFPLAELRISLGHFRRQLTAFGLYNYAADPWIAEMFPKVLPRGWQRYLESRQAQGMLHERFFTALQEWTVHGSILVIGLGGLLLWRNRPHRLLTLAVIIVFAVIGNAGVTGILSNVEDRYQSRVIWLLPLLALLILLMWAERFRRPNASSPGETTRAKCKEQSAKGDTIAAD